MLANQPENNKQLLPSIVTSWYHAFYPKKSVLNKEVGNPKYDCFAVSAVHPLHKRAKRLRTRITRPGRELLFWGLELINPPNMSSPNSTWSHFHAIATSASHKASAPLWNYPTGMKQALGILWYQLINRQILFMPFMPLFQGTP